MDDYYRSLDIDESLSCEAIAAYLSELNREYRKRTNHRDSTVRDGALAKQEEIRAARAVLGDEAERAAYDAELAGYRAEQALTQPLADIDLYDIFGLSPDASVADIQAALEQAEANPPVVRAIASKHATRGRPV